MNTTDSALLFISFIILMVVFQLSFIPPLIRIILSLIALGISIYVIVRAVMTLKNRHK